METDVESASQVSHTEGWTSCPWHPVFRASKHFFHLLQNCVCVCEYLSVEAEGSVLLNTQPVGLISTGVYPARLLSVFTSIPDTFSFCVSLLWLFTTDSSLFLSLSLFSSQTTDFNLISVSDLNQLLMHPPAPPPFTSSSLFPQCDYHRRLCLRFLC